MLGLALPVHNIRNLIMKKVNLEFVFTQFLQIYRLFIL